MIIDPREVRKQFGEDYSFNSWEHVESLRELILEDRLRVTQGLEHEWHQISRDDQSPSYNQGKPRDFLQSPTSTPIEALTTYLDMGTYPPPEILMAVADCFNLYYQLYGELELEEAFFGKPKRRSGNFAARRSWDRLCRFFHSRVEVDRDLGKNTALVALAEEFIHESENADIDVEAFLRRYRRWKSSKPLDDLIEDK
jgi:hypothetical protein